MLGLLAGIIILGLANVNWEVTHHEKGQITCLMICGAIHALFHIHYISVFSVNLSSFISLATLPSAITLRYFVSIFPTGKG